MVVPPDYAVCGHGHGSQRDATDALSRGHRVYAYGSGPLRQFVRRSARRLRGRYALTIEIAGYRPIRKELRIR